MALDIPTVTLMLSIIYVLQAFALIVQWRLVKVYSGPGWWALGMAAFALGLVLASLRVFPQMVFWGTLLNLPLYGAGITLLYVGILRFFGRRERRGLLLVACAALVAEHFFFALVLDSLPVRRATFDLYMSVVSLLSAWVLFRHRPRTVRASANLLGVVFVLRALDYGIALWLVFFDLAITNILAASPDVVLAYLDAIVTGLLWTLGFILMVNQRLSAENREANKNRERIFNTTPDAVVITRLADGTIVEVNDGFTVVTGFTRAEAIGKSTLALDLWQDAADQQQVRAALIDTGACGNLEVALRRKDGSDMVCIMSARLLTLDDAPHIVSVTRDITARRQSEEALRISETRHRLLAENGRDVIWVMELDGSISYISPSVEQMRGLTPAEAMQQPLEQILTPASQAIVQAYFQSLWAAAQAGLPMESFRGELEYYHKDGSTIWTEVMAFPVPSPSGGFVEILGVTRDIRERRQAEEALRQSEAKFRALADTSPLAIYMSVGIEQKAEYVNATFVRLFGYTMEEVPTAARWWPRAYPDALYRQQIVGEWQRKVEHAIATHSEIEPLEVVVTCKDGSHKNILWGFKTIGAQNWAFGLDLTERKRAEAALAEAKEAAEAANRAKSEFLANMSHELRTPLNAILGFSEIMAQDANLSADQQENLAIINRSGDHLLGLISDVLDMAKIEAGRSTVQAQDFDLAQLLADIKELFRARAARKGLALQVVSAPDAPHFVHTDAGKLRQVLINLLGNAIKFTAVGSVELAVAPVDPVTPGAVCRLRFTVQDTGPGIAAENLAAIFEPFVQVANGQTVHEGTGLGLPISRQFARLLEGDLTATSAGAAGQGSQFVLEIPVGVLADGAPVAQAGSLRRLHLAPDQPVYRLLVAEDRPESRKLLADLLTRLGFAVRTAENGQQALDVWAEWQPHLVWMDMRMPVMDGREATRRIKETEQGRHTVVIGVSAGVLGGQQAAVLADGCDDFVAKPFHQQEIIHCLVKHLGVRMVYTEDEPVAHPVAAYASPPQAWGDAPANWCAQVQQAATAADAARLLQLAAAVAGDQPGLAAALQTSVDAFDYGAILDAVVDIRKDI